jgi:hypothetical protein
MVSPRNEDATASSHLGKSGDREIDAKLSKAFETLVSSAVHMSRFCQLHLETLDHLVQMWMAVRFGVRLIAYGGSMGLPRAPPAVSLGAMIRVSIGKGLETWNHCSPVLVSICFICISKALQLSPKPSHSLWKVTPSQTLRPINVQTRQFSLRSSHTYFTSYHTCSTDRGTLQRIPES